MIKYHFIYCCYYSIGKDLKRLDISARIVCVKVNISLYSKRVLCRVERVDYGYYVVTTLDPSPHSLIIHKKNDRKCIEVRLSINPAPICIFFSKHSTYIYVRVISTLHTSTIIHKLKECIQLLSLLCLFLPQFVLLHSKHQRFMKVSKYCSIYLG